jgi:hypothetical protein
MYLIAIVMDTKIAVFWFVAPCSLAMIIALMMEAARTSETLENYYQTTRCYNPEDSNLHTHHRENLKSYLVMDTSENYCKAIHLLNKHSTILRPASHAYALIKPSSGAPDVFKTAVEFTLIVFLLLPECKMCDKCDYIQTVFWTYPLFYEGKTNFTLHYTAAMWPQ